MLKRGIILIATGHGNYVKMAYNLALTIKSVEDIPIAIIHTGLSHLTVEQSKIFDIQINLPENYMNGFCTKLHLDQLTPFEKTLFIDADMLWLSRKPSELFNELDGINFTIINEGNSDAVNHKYYFWADHNEIKKEYNVNKVYQVRSEVLYFERGTKVFKKARELKPERKLKTIRKFGDHIPDELYFNIAMAITGVEPHSKTWMPSYWNQLHGQIMPPLKDLKNSYYMLSFGSNLASPQMKKVYDNVMQVVCYGLGIPNLFKLKSKREWAPGRLKI